MIVYAYGDMFDARVDAVVNTVNSVGISGKGIALHFKRIAPENFKVYQRACKLKNFHNGEVLPVRLPDHYPVPFIFNFATKRHWREGSRLEDIESGLKELVRITEHLELRTVALPPIGCANGGLDWNDVERLIHEVLETSPHVVWYVYPPQRRSW